MERLSPSDLSSCDLQDRVGDGRALRRRDRELYHVCPVHNLMVQYDVHRDYRGEVRYLSDYRIRHEPDVGLMAVLGEEDHVRDFVHVCIFVRVEVYRQVELE